MYMGFVLFRFLLFLPIAKFLFLPKAVVWMNFVLLRFLPFLPAVELLFFPSMIM